MCVCASRRGTDVRVESRRQLCCVLSQQLREQLRRRGGSFQKAPPKTSSEDDSGAEEGREERELGTDEGASALCVSAAWLIRDYHHCPPLYHNNVRDLR
uniref:Uncharacterized protein n=1 Tax=Sphaerodactylus townsendi TaxID=933632 RepID=A0ACB8E8W0_9SAUR